MMPCTSQPSSSASTTSMCSTGAGGGAATKARSAVCDAPGGSALGHHTFNCFGTSILKLKGVGRSAPCCHLARRGPSMRYTPYGCAQSKAWVPSTLPHAGLPPYLMQAPETRSARDTRTHTHSRSHTLSAHATNADAPLPSTSRMGPRTEPCRSTARLGGAAGTLPSAMVPRACCCWCTLRSQHGRSRWSGARRAVAAAGAPCAASMPGAGGQGRAGLWLLLVHPAQSACPEQVVKGEQGCGCCWCTLRSQHAQSRWSGARRAVAAPERGSACCC